MEENNFQQDSAPAHKSNLCQEWLAKNVPDFISRDEWPQHHLQTCNPMDYAIWSMLSQRACKKVHKNLTSLKRALRREWGKITIEELRKIVGQFPERLKECKKKKGNHFEI